MSSFDGGGPVWARLLHGARQESPRRDGGGWTLPPGIHPLPPPEGSLPGCPLPYDWDRRSYFAFDLETTGLEPSRDRIVEIGILPFTFDAEGALVAEEGWNVLVNPGVPIPASASAIHGIYDLEVSNSPDFASLAPELLSMIGGKVLVAHNAMFDVGFLREELKRGGKGTWTGEIVDSLALSRIALPAQISHSLGKLAFTLGIDAGKSHRALDDARTCMHIFAHCARILSGACP
jgi:DNA polymerase III epsilon subunit family exonuclease